jgi:hypothetical protein
VLKICLGKEHSISKKRGNETMSVKWFSTKTLVLMSMMILLSAGSALAGDKRFCGYVALNQPTGTAGVTMDLAAGAWIDKDKVYYTSKCPDVVSDAKKKLKNKGLWDTYNWDKKEGYKCSSTKDWFGGNNICKDNCMKKDETGYQTTYVPAQKKLTCEKTG